MRPKILIPLFIALLFSGSFFVSCTNNDLNERIVFTRVPTKNIDINNLPHTFKGANLMAVDQQNSEKVTNLTPGFYSACSPQISYDAKHILFAGQKNENDLWQIWEMNIEDNSFNQITKCKVSCYSPAYLPGDKIVFSKKVMNANYDALFTMKHDGTGVAQITFHPNSDYVTTILKDGRILMNSRQILPVKGKTKYLAMRPNGTKAILFYSGNDNSPPGLSVCETEDGKIFFTEKRGEKTDIISISYKRPLHSKINYTKNIKGNFHSVLWLTGNKLIVSYSKAGANNSELREFSLNDKTLGKSLCSDSEYCCFEPVLVKPYQRPRKLPNDIVMQQTSGLFLCTNINLTSAADTIPETGIKACKIEVLGMDRSLGTVKVEKDGSFYLKVDADTPVRIQTLDKNGNIVNGPSEWFWIRPFERRGCVGCHANPELVPQNIVPMAVNKDPVLITADTTKTGSKSGITKVSEMK